jgi:trimeric autotransporter adhesin
VAEGPERPSSLDLSGERGLSPFDQRHVVNASAQYTTGMGLGGGTLLDGWRGRIYKEWTLLTQLTAGTGMPETPTEGALIPGTIYSLRPDFTGASVYNAPPGLFLNPAAFTAAPAGQFGNAGRDSIRGPAQLSLNASMSRVFRLTDRFNLELQINSTNVLNHVVYSSYITNISSPSFGTPGGTNAMRQISTILRLRF